MKSKFEQEHSFEQRKAETDRIREKYPNRIPVICEKVEKSDIAEIDKKKYLVPVDLTVGQFIYVIRKRIKLSPEKAFFIFVNNVLPPTAFLMSQIYDEHKDKDGYLYISYSGENTFGNDELLHSSIKTPKFSFLGIENFCKVVKVYDGDTINVNMYFNHTVKQFKIRMFGYDTEEMKDSNLEKKANAYNAQKYLSEILLNKIVYLKCGEFDKYGRILGHVYLNKNDTKSINEIIVEKGFGKPYSGGQKTISQKV